jgi:peptidoglycan/LPS O-acetylase OafA/YrhL
VAEVVSAVEADAPVGLAPPPGNPRFPLVDGVRAIAALSIVLVHSAYLSGWADAVRVQLSVGVPVFFVISGFLLYRPFVVGRLSGRGRIGTASFARRRLLRIVPAFWVAMTVLALYPGLSDVLGRRAPLFYGFAQTFQPQTTFKGLVVAWSLSTEMSFYLVLPLYALLLARVCAGRREGRVIQIELGALLVLSVGSLVFRAVFFGRDWNLAYTLPGTFDWFAVGMGLAVISAVTARRQTTPRLVRLAGRYPEISWAAALTVFVSMVVYAKTIGRPDWAYSAGPLHYLWALFALCLVVPAVFSSTGLPARFLSLKPVAWLGLVSYGIFLWHVPVLNKIASEVNGFHNLRPNTGLGLLTVLVVGGGLSIALGAASYYVVERPFLRLKDKPKRERAAKPKLAEKRQYVTASAVVIACLAAFSLLVLLPEALGDRPYNPIGGHSHQAQRHHSRGV